MSTMSDMGGPDAGNPSDMGNGQGEGITIDSITPAEGPADASTDVVILGTGFQPGAELLVGAENVGVTETKSQRIRATVPEGFTPGTYDVIVTNPDGASARLEKGYTVTEGGAADAGGGGKNTGGKASSGCGCTTTAPAATPLWAALIAALFAMLAVAVPRERARVPARKERN